MAEDMLKLLCSTAKLDRDKGLQQLQEFLKKQNVDDVREFENKLVDLMSDGDSTWEKKHGSLMAAKTIMDSQHFSTEYGNRVLQKSLILLDDKEYRVRISAGEVIGSLCRTAGADIYKQAREKVLTGIRENLERQPLDGETGDDRCQQERLMEKLVPGSIPPSPPPSPPVSPLPAGQQRRRNSAEQIFHDTAGWKSLETWMKCLQAAIEGCGPSFNSFVDQELLDLIFAALVHTNRFVRETGYYVCSSLVDSGPKETKEDEGQVEDNAIYRHGDQFSEYLGKGLADNWSQVRLASSVATRKFLMNLSAEEAREKYYSCLLPRMCLNRYYVAEGVRIYSQETWKLITHGVGKSLVEKYIKNVVEFYIAQTEADNHAVREAACACIAELGSKVEKTLVSPNIPQLLAALVVCFNDDSWPVRDAACVACGNFVKCFPEESRGTMPELYPLFFSNLEDNIPSVRQGAALALAHVVQAYGEESLSVILPKLRAGLEGVEHQAACVEKYGGLDKGPATYGVVKHLRDNDMELHTDQQMYSCGSLAPKMGRGSRGGGCMDHKFRKPPEPWEMADGCVHLLAELSPQQPHHQKLAELLPVMSQTADRHHYTQHVAFLETVCKQIPNIAKGLGKRAFKPHLEQFMDSLFYSLSCDNILTSTAASQCLSQLSAFLGPSILRGRVEQHNPRYLEQLNQVAGPPVIM
ncbi:uncharacterized protein [Haliotis cracherodii]|uniref:uncharacterized protein n=1 Tax=Haliotis cracherodii TaxID=6455 RepID=UPI0039E7574C